MHLVTRIFLSFATLVLPQVVLSVSSIPAFAEGSYIGLVTHLTGKWTVTEGSKCTPVKLWSSIPAGAFVKADSEDSDIEIQLVDRSVVTRHGNKLANKTIDLKKEPDGFFDRIFRIVHEQPQAFVTTMARGTDNLTDSVVILNESSVDFADVFKEMKPGKYLFKLTAKNGRNDNPESKTFVLNFAKGAKAAIALAGTTPGLYELKTIEVVDEQERPLQKCWVALVSQENAADATRKWREAKVKTKDWKDRPNACSRTCFLKAVLFSLARADAQKS